MTRAPVVIAAGLVCAVSCAENAIVIMPPDATSSDANSSDVALDGVLDVGVDATLDAADSSEASPCDAGLSLCGSACVDLQNDAIDCGFCGHDCLGQLCSIGTCKTEVIAPQLDWPGGLAIYGKTFYFTEAGSGGGGALDGDVVACPLTGCAGNPIVMTSGLDAPAAVVVDSANVYWLNRSLLGTRGGSAMSCPLGGCGPSDVNRVTLADNLSFPAGLALDANAVYFADWGDKPFAAGIFESCAIGGCANSPTPIVTTLNKPMFAATNATDAFVLATGNTSTTAVIQAPLGQTTTGTVIETDSTASYAWLALFGASVDWVDQAHGTVRECSQQGCNSNSVAITQGLQKPVAVLHDAKGYYFIDAATQTLLYCVDAASCATPIELARHIAVTPIAMAMDASYVYWLDRGDGVNDGTGFVARVAR